MALTSTRCTIQHDLLRLYQIRPDGEAVRDALVLAFVIVSPVPSTSGHNLDPLAINHVADYPAGMALAGKEGGEQVDSVWGNCSQQPP